MQIVYNSIMTEPISVEAVVRKNEQKKWKGLKYMGITKTSGSTDEEDV